MVENSTVVILKDEYEQLQDSERLLDALYAAGVDNWDGFSYALEIYHNEN
jgi:hypothetical protein